RRGRASCEGSYLGLLQGDETVGLDLAVGLARPRRPGDPERELLRAAEAEVDDLVGARAHARRAAEHLAGELRAAGRDDDPRAAAVAVRDRPDGVHLEPALALEGGDVLVQVRAAVLVDHVEVEPAVAVEVGDRDPAGLAGVVRATRRAQVEELPVVRVDVQLVRLRREALAVPDVQRPQVPGADVEVLPAVEVEVAEGRAPGDASL